MIDWLYYFFFKNSMHYKNIIVSQGHTLTIESLGGFEFRSAHLLIHPRVFKKIGIVNCPCHYSLYSSSTFIVIYSWFNYLPDFSIFPTGFWFPVNLKISRCPLILHCCFRKLFIVRRIFSGIHFGYSTFHFGFSL